MTRAMMVTVLHRLAGTPDGVAFLFSDVESKSWFAEAVAALLHRLAELYLKEETETGQKSPSK